MTGLWAVLAAFTIVTVSPGPANLAVCVAAMAHGAGPALRMAAGLALGLALWGVVAASGMGAILAASEAALTLLRLIGGAYLLWLAWRSAQAALTPSSDAAPQKSAAGFRTGLMLNLTNPKAAFAWMAALALGLTDGGSAGGLIVAVALCALIGLANYLGWALVMSRGTLRRFYQRARRSIDGVAAALFGIAGAELLRQGATR